MSLNFDLSKIANREMVTADPRDSEKLNPVTEALIWSTMSIDMGTITAANIDEWLVRLALADKLFGTMLYVGSGPTREPRPFTRSDLESHIGLTTNVSTRTRAHFTKRVLESFYREATYRMRRDAEKKAPEVVA